MLNKDKILGLWAQKIEAEWYSNMEFRVEDSGRHVICVDCHQYIKTDERRVRVFKRSVKANDCYYHVECFVTIHKDEFKKMCVDIVNGAMLVK
jgi:hypothetical protein